MTYYTSFDTTKARHCHFILDELMKLSNIIPHNTSKFGRPVKFPLPTLFVLLGLKFDSGLGYRNFVASVNFNPYLLEQLALEKAPSYSLLQNRNLLVRRHVDRASRTRRTRVTLLLVYYIIILIFAWSMSGSWWWSFEEGLMWSSGGPGMFFPIPFPPGMAGVITPAYPIDQVFYLVFMHCGIWIAWIALGLLYLFSPYRVDLRLLLDKVRTRLRDGSRG